VAAWKAQGGRKPEEWDLGVEVALPEPSILLLGDQEDAAWLADRLDRLAGIDSTGRDDDAG
jgi:hypothetical protein